MANFSFIQDWQVPVIIRRSGGWFVCFDDGKSGPWATEEAAQAAAAKDFAKARNLENAHKYPKKAKAGRLSSTEPANGTEGKEAGNK